MWTLQNLHKRFRYVAFIDVSDSVGLYRRLGDTRAQSRIHTALKSAAALVERYNGRIVKQSGDEILCVFTNAQESVSALCNVQSAVCHVEFRIGMHVGPVLLQRQDVFGDVVNLASRLTSIAKARQIILSEDVVDNLSPADRQQCRWYDEVRLRGCESKLTLYHVGWEPDLETVANTVQGNQFPSAHAILLQLKDKSWEISNAHALVTLGRDRHCTITINSERISRLHAQLEFRRGKLVISDRSTNGTYVRQNFTQLDTYIWREELLLSSPGVISLGMPLSDRNCDNTLSYRIR